MFVKDIIRYTSYKINEVFRVPGSLIAERHPGPTLTLAVRSKELCTVLLEFWDSSSSATLFITKSVQSISSGNILEQSERERDWKTRVSVRVTVRVKKAMSVWYISACMTEVQVCVCPAAITKRSIIKVMCNRSARFVTALCPFADRCIVISIIVSFLLEGAH